MFPDPNLKMDLIMQLVNRDITSDFYNSLKSGNLKECAQNIFALVSMLNAREEIANGSVSQKLVTVFNY